MTYRYSICLLILILLALLNSPVKATPYWEEADYNARQMSIKRVDISEKIALEPKEVDSYSLLFEYLQICEFLAAMQEQDPLDPNYGGMHEGETPALWNIVQTDNTQEAIRVWCTYGEISGDLETYRDNIDAAWVYTMNYPAYNEEGSESDYYRVHNCGWGLVAEYQYRQVYNDDYYLWYADSCATYIQQHRLGYSGFPTFYNRLHPLVEGWAAGTLYDYGIDQNDEEAVNHAIMVGDDVQDWIDADPNRLAENEVWAMSGGTAMWGVCRSVFVDDPQSGQQWLPTVLSFMDTYAGPGEWNNSWNVWYAYAYHASAAVLSDPTYTGFAYALVDTLLDADTDNDGGIMATSTDPDSADQSWVSCYLDYMGMEYLINELPASDAGALSFLLPDTTLPIGQYEAYDVSVLVGNTGLESFGNINVQISGAYSSTGSTFLDFADVDTVELGQWTPSTYGLTELIMTISPGGEISENDTLVLPVQVLGWGIVEGLVTDAEDGDPISARLDFYRDGQLAEDPIYTVFTEPSSGQYMIDVLEGIYQVIIDPEIPYTEREVDGIEVQIEQTTNLNFSLFKAPILLVDDDAGASYDTSYFNPLSRSGYDAYQWDASVTVPMVSDLLIFDAVIWMTGDELDSALTWPEINSLALFLENNGNLLISGQNIAESIAEEEFLAGYLGAVFEQPTSGQMQVVGVDGDPVMAGMTMYFPGAGGAGNQTSPDVISAIGSGNIAATYPAGSLGAAVHVDGDYKSLFLAFGLEGVSGGAGSTTRDTFLEAVMEWFGVPPMSIEEEPGVTLPADFSLLELYPNPFNLEVELSFALMHPDKIQLTIYNFMGQKIEGITLGQLQAGKQRASYRFDAGLGSGTYYFFLSGNNRHTIARGVLLK